MIREVLPLTGMQSFFAFQAYHTLLLGLKMLPAYLSQSYEDFYASVDLMPPEDQIKLIKEGLLFVKFDEDEIKIIAGFCKDPNGVPYSKENIKNLKPDEIYEIMVSVFSKMAEIKINFVTPSEKKN